MPDYYREIDQLEIVKKLRGTQFERNFENLVNYAAPILESGPVIRNIGFTPHDFTHHCKNIYIILDRMLPEKFYQEYKEENLFVLLVAVLFHDVGMTGEWSSEIREKHSEISKQFIMKPFVENDVHSVIKSNVRSNYVDYICDIIYAHSDIKKNGEIEKETFIEVCKKYEEAGVETKGENETINVPFLAALLRLADELDVSYERIEDIDYLKKVNLPSSYEHFKLCEMFKMVQKGNNGDTTLVLQVEGTKYNVGEDYEKATRAAQILERYEKICKEFRMMKTRVLCNTLHVKSSDVWKIQKIELKVSGGIDLEADAKKKRIKLDNAGFVKGLIIKENLFKSGHYEVNEKLSARDWIDIDGLFKLEEAAFIKPITEMMKPYVESQKTIIGINYYGAVLASIIGYKYKKPFAYFFDSDKVVDSLEREINHIEKDGIMLIIDIVVFGNSLARVIESLAEKGIIDEQTGVDVIILFERSPQRKRRPFLSKAYSNRYIKKIYTVDDNFNIELCNKNKDECIFRQGCKSIKCSKERY